MNECGVAWCVLAIYARHFEAVAFVELHLSPALGRDVNVDVVDPQRLHIMTQGVQPMNMTRRAAARQSAQWYVPRSYLHRRCRCPNRGWGPFVGALPPSASPRPAWSSPSPP